MKKKIHLIVVLVLLGFFITSFKNMSQMLETQYWESIINYLGGEKIKELKAFVEIYQQSGGGAVVHSVHPDLLPRMKDFEKFPIARYFFSHKPRAITPIGYNVRNNASEKYRRCSFQYDFDEKPYFLLGSNSASILQEPGPYSIMVTLQEIEQNNKAQITGVDLQFLSLQEKQKGEFSLKDKSLFHLGFLAVAILVPVFVLLTLIQFVRLPEACQKSGRLLFIAFGFMDFSLNWCTGDITSGYICVSLLGAGIMKLGIYDPWMLSVSLPIGAFLFWFKRKKWVSEYQTSQQSTPSPN